MTKNLKVTITDDSGCQHEAIAPVIISASRSTDIPAFYAQWFINRLKKGYCVWVNPFNQKPSYIAFNNCKVVVFWTKNPLPLIPLLHELDDRGIHYYFQYTLNDYEPERFEPAIPPLQQRITTFTNLSHKIGPEKVIWRFDPLIVTPQLTPRQLLTRIYHIGNQLKGLTRKLVFSFVDIRAYRKVQSNLLKETNAFQKDSLYDAEGSREQRLEIVDGLSKLKNVWAQQGWDIEMATCGEDIDFASFGINKNRCIDGELMKRIFPNDASLIHYLNTGQLIQNTQSSLFDDPATPKIMNPTDWKDKGQRAACGCMVSKDIGMYNTCSHFCVYCYANSSRKSVIANKSRHNPNAESLIS